MGKIVALDERTREWARQKFAEYYAHTAVPAPERLARREFAAFPFSAQTLMRRHASFSHAEALTQYLRQEVPRHVYYSSAYYREPDRPRMEEKGWLGADLIFDLDADHLAGAADLRFSEQLSRVKERLTDLVDDFLVRDFGIPRDDLRIVFSGGRGYHVHVRSEGFLTLKSPERREIVDYVQGQGFDATTAIVPTVSESDIDDQGRRGRRISDRLYPPDAPGWQGRATRAFLAELERWERAGEAATKAELVQLDVPERRAGSLARALVTEGKARQIRENLSLAVFPKDPPREVFEKILRRAAVGVQGETDAPVTTDIHRLIRLPGSLHGGSGLRVVPLEREELDRFEPLRDARGEFSKGPDVSVRLSAPVDYEFDNSAIRGGVGDQLTLSPPVALFLTLRGEAALPP